MKILHIDSSPMFSSSVSRLLSAKIVAAVRMLFPDARTTYRDLAADPLPHLTEEAFTASRLPVEVLTRRQVQERGRTDALIDELLASDVVVIGVPMYNLSIPTQLKAWLDRIAQPGRTFRYTERGIAGLITGMKVILASSRGGIYSQGPARERDFQERYMREALSMLGIADVFLVRAEGVNISTQMRDTALERADLALCDVLASLDPAASPSGDARGLHERAVGLESL